MQPTLRAVGMLAVGAAALTGLAARGAREAGSAGDERPAAFGQTARGASVTGAQTQTAHFKARLSPVPVETSTAASITGSGVVAATLTGTKLSVSGTFGGMKSAATLAQVHMGPRGVRGPVEFDLTAEKASSGSVSGSMILTKVQVDSLRKGWFYVQIHAEQAPDGNLWGWLLPL